MSSSHQPARRGQQQLDARFSPDGGGVGRFAFSLFFYFVCVYAALYNARWVVPWNKRATNNQVDGWDGGLHHRPRRRQSFSELLLFFFSIFGCWCGAGAPSTSRRQLVPDPVDIFSKVRPSVRVFASFLYSTWNRESPPTPISFSPVYFDCFSLLSSLVCICRGETHHSLNYSIREPWFFFAFKSLASCCVSSHSTAVHSYFLFLFWEPTLSKIFQKNKNFQHFSH